MPALPAIRYQHDFRELDMVRTCAAIGIDEDIIPSGSLGTIVIVHRDGRAFEVEFADPIAALVTLEIGDVEPA